MAVNEPLSLLEPVDLPLRDADLFYVVQSDTSTSTASRQITFLDFLGEISTSVTGIEVQVEGVPITDQTLLNLTAGSNVTITNPSGGLVVIESSGGGGGGGGGLTLIERKQITSDSTTVTFNTGIAGNTDAEYILRGQIINNSGSLCGIVLRPNGVTTNLKSGQASLSGTGVFQGSTNTLRFANIPTGGTQGFTINIHAKKNTNSQALPFTFDGSVGSLDGAGVGAVFVSGGVWSETSTEMTSLDVFAEVANGIGNGSYLCLYKLAQT